MAGGVAIALEPGKDYPGKMTMLVFLACLVSAWEGLIFGYNIGISGGVTSMAPFLKKFFPSVYRRQNSNKSVNQYCTFDSEILTLFTSSLYLATLASSLVASKVTRSFGRKLSMMLGGIVFLAGAIINGAAANVAMLIIGRILFGIGVGFANQSVPLYLSEMAPYKYHGGLNIGFQLMITIGILAANILNYFTAKIEGGWGWRVSLGGAAVPALFITIGGIFLPDTPNSVIERKDPEKARRLLRRIRGTDDIEQEYKDLVAASEASKKIEDPRRKILMRKYRPHLVMAILIPFFQQVTGINVIMFYAPVLFKTLGFGGDASLMSAVITGLVNVAATCVSIYQANRKGRRCLFLQGGIQMVIFQCGVGALIWSKIGTSGSADIPSGYAAGVVVCICLFVAGFAWSWGPLGWLVSSEIFPLEIRSAAQSINVSVNMFFTFLIAQIFLKLLCNMKFGLFFMFGGFVLIMTLFIFFFFLPETKGIPIEEMEQDWRQHWYWGRFVPSEEDIELETRPGKVI